MSGWIKLHRQIVNSSKFADPDILRLWILCLTKAAHKSGVVVMDKQEISLEPGQFITGRFSLSQEYNESLSPRKRIKDTTLWSWLKRLEEWGDLDIKSTNKYSIVTVLKWTDYQEGLTTELQQNDNKLTTELQQTDTNKNVKNLKNEKNEKKKDIKPNTAFSDYTSNDYLLSTLESFVDFRKKIKSPMTDRAVKVLLNNLDKLAKTDEEKIAVLEQSIFNGWKGVFELKDRLRLTAVNGNRSAGPTKPQIPIVSDAPVQSVSAAELEELKKLAKKLDAKEKNVI